MTLFFLRRSLGITLHIGYMVESHTVETGYKVKSPIK